MATVTDEDRAADRRVVARMEVASELHVALHRLR